MLPYRHMTQLFCFMREMLTKRVGGIFSLASWFSEVNMAFHVKSLPLSIGLRHREISVYGSGFFSTPRQDISSEKDII